MFKKISFLAMILLIGLIALGASISFARNDESPPFAVAQALTEEELALGLTGDVQYFASQEDALHSIGQDPALYDTNSASVNDSVTSRPADPEPVGKHCVVEIESIQHGAAESKMSEAVCFDTFSKAISASTLGEVRLAEGFQPAHLTPSMLVGTSSTTVIGIDYSSPNFQGSSLVWYANNTVGCNTGSSYAASTMPSGWNDVVSSAQTYGGCNNNPHYEHNNWTGASLTCTCSSMGVMDNQTSSERWSQ